MTLPFFLVLLLAASQVADAVLTYLIIRKGGHEDNPLLVAAQRVLPGRWTWLVVVKTAAIGAAWVVYLLKPVVLPVLVIIYGAVLWHNAIELAK